jgi:hypothetical protein
MVHDSLGRVRSWRGRSCDGCGRVAELFDQTFPRFKEYEPQLRAALIIAVEHGLRERAGLLEDEIFGANDRKVETIARWMAQALVDAALRDAREASSSAQTRTPRSRVKNAKSRGNGTRTAR